jgi:hypothetical protein
MNQDQKLMRVPLAVEIVTGERPSPSKCWRWYMHGIKGVKLETWVVGGSRLTSLAAVREFIATRTHQASLVRSPMAKRPKLSKQTREFLRRELGV